MATPGDLNRKEKTPIPAQGVNTLGEPMQGAWWVKRHYYQPMSIEQLVAGPGKDHPPSTEGAWTVVGAKNEDLVGDRGAGLGQHRVAQDVVRGFHGTESPR